MNPVIEEAAVQDDTELPSPGHADVRVVAATPEVARRVAEVVRRCFDTAEQRSYPAGPEGGTLLRLTVDTSRPAGPARSWLESSEPVYGDERTSEGHSGEARTGEARAGEDGRADGPRDGGSPAGES
ncbi:hypothetical protein [Streptomyces thermolilacinus]|uniref:hypothetical protein n=1 Tax=Streptomyces thermolilacinus TaxID=285540 RepID=UPI003F4CFFF9